MVHLNDNVAGASLVTVLHPVTWVGVLTDGLVCGDVEVEGRYEILKIYNMKVKIVLFFTRLLFVSDLG